MTQLKVFLIQIYIALAGWLAGEQVLEAHLQTLSPAPADTLTALQVSPPPAPPPKVESGPPANNPQFQNHQVAFDHSGKKLNLIFAPHPDDETLGCARLIRSALERGEYVKIIYLTNGDAFSKDNPDVSKNYGQTRVQEAKTVAQRLGLQPDDLEFLGFPDGYLTQMLTDQGTITSDFTHATATPEGARYGNLRYDLQLFKNTIKVVMGRYKPDRVYYTSRYDRHPDHQAIAQLFEDDLLTDPKAYPKTAFYSYIIHRHRQPGWYSDTVDEWKLDLIREFTSQRHDRQHEVFLDTFAKQKERFTLRRPALYKVPEI